MQRPVPSPAQAGLLPPITDCPRLAQAATNQKYAPCGPQLQTRALFAAMPELRENDNKNWHTSFGTKRIEQSALFRPMLKNNTCKFKTDEFYELCYAMRSMHLHSPTAEGDHIHQACAI